MAKCWGNIGDACHRAACSYSFSDAEKIKALQSVNETADLSVLSTELHKDTLSSMKAIKRYNRSMAKRVATVTSSAKTSALNVMEVYGLLLFAGWNAAELAVDIVPLFETVDDLEAAPQVMKALYENSVYGKHLEKRQNANHYAGFFRRHKDGGYLMANWGIYKSQG